MDGLGNYYSVTWNWSTVGFHSHNPMATMVTIFYLLLVLSIGLWAVLSHNRATVKDFFLAGGNLTWWLIGTSLFAANTGSGHFMGLAGIGASSGIAVGALEWNSILMLFVLGWIFIPIYIKAEVVTLPEYLRKRFGSIRIQLFLSVLYLILHIFGRISLEICYGAMFLKMAWDIDIYQTTLMLLTIAGIYTITGGLTAVVYAEAFQAGVMLLGSSLLTMYTFSEVGGYKELVDKYFHAIPNVVSEGNWTSKPACYLPRSDALHIFRDPISGDIPWPAVVFGASTLSLFYGCADQVSVQRLLAGKNMSHRKGGCLLYGYLKLLPMFLIVIPGMISRILFPNHVACVVPSECQKYCGAQSSCSPMAYPLLVVAVLPTGLQGFMLSTVCAALMSSLTSVFNSATTVFTMNIYVWIRPMATEKELMIAGRFFVIILLAITIVWIPVMETSHSETLFEHMQVTRSYLVPPVTALFLLAVLCKRVNEQGAFWGLILGMMIGFFRLLAMFAYGSWTCNGENECPAFICGLHYLYFSTILFLISVLSMLIISLITDPIPDKHLHRLCWSLRNSREKRVALDSGIRWKRLPSNLVHQDLLKDSQTCLWNTWDLFCGLEPWPDSKLTPINSSEGNMEASKEEIECSEILGDAQALDLGETDGKMELTEKKQKDTEYSNVLEKPCWKRTVNVIGIILVLLVVMGHIYYA
ncbi:sodium/glucose cotransporter 1-like [Dipodomys merriami]|uniref:sodium/glucose cotransporter 1-like n=1 Tax=Dipodomys merriami TaxID=94247 RepID=UPI003855CB11